MAVHGDGSAALADQLIQRGMPEALAQDLSPEDAEALADVTSFTEIKGEGGKKYQSQAHCRHDRCRFL